MENKSLHFCEEFGMLASGVPTLHECCVCADIGWDRRLDGSRGKPYPLGALRFLVGRGRCARRPMTLECFRARICQQSHDADKAENQSDHCYDEPRTFRAEAEAGGNSKDSFDR